MGKPHKHEEEERFPGVDPIPEPERENPSSTSMIEEILEEGSQEAAKRKQEDE
ncbi:MULTISPECIES: hypothetical protein [Paenibacillus]|uniref:Uncharacterized protein n=1 Tax=Paenibacillus albilobatus TaxID=2716884 RepID=A0A919XDL4_9BACL|nr:MULTISPECIES: hypothetical protein [Paenibacillus]MDR9852857.1 hypothetical protein [Paenibacillus sp. VCA1]GIO30589.1 hypothetical protein J2TS6_17300 [Paenibacillus albilobatus]